jgi:hypothetical protein
MPSLKQRIDDAVQTLVEDVLDLIRTTSLRELEELVSPAPPPPAPAARPPVPRRPPAKKKPATRERPERLRAPEVQSQFDVTSPELLLAAEPQQEPVSTKVPTEAPLPVSTPPAAVPAVTMPPVPTLRPGETVARASASGIVIRREKRAIERP